MIGGKLKKLRQERGYSLTRLAKEAGVSKSYLSYLERDLRENPSLQTLEKVANTLNVSLDNLLETKRKENNNSDDLHHEFMDLFKLVVGEEGISKGDLSEFREFMKFKNWQITNKK
ncbi:helix-turn-helix transcriptional regulator [Lentibacillus sp. N15]|uniref:helix-turn-helix domain-containing protein n=1 Tax=Lentibacillus songyuanensis TaxID=3136161 RepID=UPI0031BB07FC